MSERIFRRAIIHGRVQGVGYRDWTRHVARSRGIEGWVRNRKDGTVEALFAADREAIEAIDAEPPSRGERAARIRLPVPNGALDRDFQRNVNVRRTERGSRSISLRRGLGRLEGCGGARAAARKP